MCITSQEGQTAGPNFNKSALGSSSLTSFLHKYNPLKNTNQQNQLKTENIDHSKSILQKGDDRTYIQKAKMVREIQLQLSLLESKSRQPGIQSNDIQPLGDEIYQKLDQYFITFGQIKQTKKYPPPPDQKSFLSPDPFSQKQTTQNQIDLKYRNTSHITANLSVESLSDEEEQRPFFENRLSESQLEGMDREGLRQMSEIDQRFSENYLEMKETIRVMEERIAFLIYRLEESKKEASSLRETNRELQEGLETQKQARRQLRCSLQDKNFQHSLIFEDYQQLQLKLNLLETDILKVNSLNDHLQKQNAGLRQILQKARQNIEQQQSKINSLTSTLNIKIDQYRQLSRQFNSIEKSLEKRKQLFLRQLQESQGEKIVLQKTLKACRLMVQAEGINFNFQEAHKLKQIFQQKQVQQLPQLQREVHNLEREVARLQQEKTNAQNKRQQLQSALSDWIDISHLTGGGDSTPKNNARQGFLSLVGSHQKLTQQNEDNMKQISIYQEHLEIVKQQCQLKYLELQNIKTQFRQQQTTLQKVTAQKQQLIQYLHHMTSKDNRLQHSRLSHSKLDSHIVDINLAQKVSSTPAEITLQLFLRKQLLHSPTHVLIFGIKLIEHSLQLQITHKRKLPSLAPHTTLVTIKDLKEASVSFSLIAKKEEEEGLIYQAPQIVLGFAESPPSHSWTIGLILDQMLHKKRFFKAFNDILSHKDSYFITNTAYKGMTFLTEMVRKNHKNRLGLQEAKDQMANWIRRHGK